MLKRGSEHEPTAGPLPYGLVCTLLGFALGWLPSLVHGPIPEKFDRLYIDGAIAVRGFFAARLLIGFLVGITHWPRHWWIRGPLCGLFALFPISLIILATPGCRGPCMFWNLLSASAVGMAVGGLAYAITGKHHG